MSLKADKPILRLLQHPAGGLVVLTADSVLYSSDHISWATLHQSQDGALNDLALITNDEKQADAYVLTRGGNLLHGVIPE